MFSLTQWQFEVLSDDKLFDLCIVVPHISLGHKVTYTERRCKVVLTSNPGRSSIKPVLIKWTTWTRRESTLYNCTSIWTSWLLVTESDIVNGKLVSIVGCVWLCRWRSICPTSLPEEMIEGIENWWWTSCLIRGDWLCGQVVKANIKFTDLTTAWGSRICRGGRRGRNLHSSSRLGWRSRHDRRWRWHRRAGGSRLCLAWCDCGYWD